MFSSVLDRPAVRPSIPVRPLPPVDGRESLEALIEQHGALPGEVALECMLKIVEAMRAEPTNGLAYRRLAPSQVMIDDQGNVALDRAGGLGERTDDPTAILADLAGILYSLVTGQSQESHASPRRNGFLTTRLGWGRQPAASLLAIRPDVSADLDSIYRRMLSKRPGERFPNLTCLFTALLACGE